MSGSIPASTGPEDESLSGSAADVVDPASRPVRWSFTAAYRARVVAEYEAVNAGRPRPGRWCGPGDRGSRGSLVDGPR
jgi:hypothetical protein